MSNYHCLSMRKGKINHGVLYVRVFYRANLLALDTARRRWLLIGVGIMKVIRLYKTACFILAFCLARQW